MDESSKHTIREMAMQMEAMVLLPHEMISHMCEKHRLEFDRYWLGSEPLASFWNTMVPSHPILRVHDYKNRAIPMDMHGDGISVGKGKGRSLDLISISSLTGDPAPTTWDSKLLMDGVMSGAKFGGG